MRNADFTRSINSKAKISPLGTELVAAYFFFVAAAGPFLVPRSFPRRAFPSKKKCYVMNRSSLSPSRASAFPPPCQCTLARYTHVLSTPPQNFAPR